jgi:hypothetical protein
MRLHPRGEGLGLVEAAADEARSFDVKLAEVVQGLDVFGIEFRGALEGHANLDGEAKRAQRVRMGRLESVRATEPHLIFTAVGVVRDCQLTLMDGVVGQILSIVDAAEKLMSLSVARVCGKYLAKAGGGFIDATLLEISIGLSCVGKEKANAKEEQNRKGNLYTGRRSRDEHD